MNRSVLANPAGSDGSKGGCETQTGRGHRNARQQATRCLGSINLNVHGATVSTEMRPPRPKFRGGAKTLPPLSPGPTDCGRRVYKRRAGASGIETP